MKIEYICHSTLLIDTGEVKILTDPWIKGSAYCNQWHLFPKPVNTDIASKADYILFSHGHEDHLHHESLLSINKDSNCFYPYQWQKGIQEYFNELGFKSTTEAISNKKYKLSNTTYVTYIANALDSIIVIEAGDKVLVNINDALPANHINIIDKFLDLLKKRWPKIDYLFCSYGSAAYFPNTVHHRDKNDIEIAEAREQLFAHNFCHIVDQLCPACSVPFAADWVLLNDEKRWINNIKFSKKELSEYYTNIFKGTPTTFINAYSGDVIEDEKLKALSPYHKEDMNTTLDSLIDNLFQEEIKQVNDIVPISEEEIKQLEYSILENITQRSTLFTKEKLDKIKFTLILKHITNCNMFFIDCSSEKPSVSRVDKIVDESILTLTTTSKILNYCFNSEWGGDSIIIGYGAEIEILDLNIITESLDIICVRLLTRQPVASNQMKSDPARAIKYLITNPLTTSWAIKQLINSKGSVNKNPVNNRDLWLNKSKCEICQVCDVPYLTDEFSKSL